MFKTRFKRVLTFGWQGFMRNGWLSFIAVVTLSFSVMAISVLGVLNQVNKQVQQNLENKLDLAVFFRDAAPEEKVVDFVQQVNKRSDVREVTYIDKDEARQQFLEENATDEALIGAVNELENPFPRFVRIQADAPATLARLNEFASQTTYQEIVESTSYQQTKDIVANFVNTAKFTRLNSIVVMLFFIIYSVLVVFNMIRLAIFSRREEVEIMRVVGATNVLIRWPFVVEGILFGLIGALISLLMIWIAARWESGQLMRYFSITDAASLPSGYYQQYFGVLFWTNIIGSVILATTASYLAVRRYLRI
jgi:cell division transport system permease protein